jgi:O-antigen/teichoic acid export membrane protein
MESSSAPTRQAVARAVSWVGAGHVVSQGVWLASLLVLAALLPPRDFGTLASALVLITLAGLLVDSGTRGSLIARPQLTRADVRGALALNLAIGLAATTAIALLAGPAVRTFAGGGDIAAVRVLSLGVLLYAAGISAFALLQRELALKGYAAANIASAIVSSVVAVVAALAGAGVWALVVRQLLSMGLLSGFAWIAARRLLPPREVPGRRASGGGLRLRQPEWTGFFLLAAADFVVLNADVFVVGNLTEAEGLGLYSLAFTLAFAPLTQIAWQVGRVLFPAAAATERLHDVGRRTLVSLRLMALLLLPFVPPVIAAAPVLPQVLGQEWAPMVVPFQVLLVAGAGHALVSVIGESLSGTGNIRFRAHVNVVWAVAMVGALIALVSAAGIRGAALAHLLLYVPFAGVYAVWGGRRLGLSVRAVGGALRSVAVPLAVQGAATAAVVLALRAAGWDPAPAGLAGAAVGAAVVLVLLLRLPSSPLPEGRAILAEALQRDRSGDGAFVSHSERKAPGRDS